MFFHFHPSIWGRCPFWLNNFQKGWFNHQPDIHIFTQMICSFCLTYQGFSCTCSRCDSARYGPRGSYVPGIKVRKLRKAIKNKGLPGLLAISRGVSVGCHHSICQVASGKISFFCGFLMISGDERSMTSTPRDHLGPVCLLGILLTGTSAYWLSTS